MENLTLLIVLLAILSIIPALITAVVLWLKNEAVRGDVLSANMRSETSARDCNHLINQYQALQLKITDAENLAYSVQQKLNALEESFVNLNNKWVSRERAEKIAARREEKAEKKEEPVDDYEIPGTEQLNLFPPPSMDKPEIPVRRRRFGEMP